MVLAGIIIGGIIGFLIGAASGHPGGAGGEVVAVAKGFFGAIVGAIIGAFVGGVLSSSGSSSSKKPTHAIKRELGEIAEKENNLLEALSLYKASLDHLQNDYTKIKLTDQLEAKRNRLINELQIKIEKLSQAFDRNDFPNSDVPIKDLLDTAEDHKKQDQIDDALSVLKQVWERLEHEPDLISENELKSKIEELILLKENRESTV